MRDGNAERSEDHSSAHCAPSLGQGDSLGQNHGVERRERLSLFKSPLTGGLAPSQARIQVDRPHAEDDRTTLWKPAALAAKEPCLREPAALLEASVHDDRTVVFSAGMPGLGDQSTKSQFDDGAAGDALHGAEAEWEIETGINGENVSGLSWALLDHLFSAEVSLEIRLRVLVDVLKNLQVLHTKLTLPPEQRCHGRLTPQAFIVCVNGISCLAEAGCAAGSRRFDACVPANWPSAEHLAEDTYPHYVAPEVHHGQAPDQQADIYGAGVFLWEALERSAQVIPRFASPQSESELERALAAWAKPLVQIALRCQSPNPRERIQSARELRSALESVIGEHLGQRAELAALVKRGSTCTPPSSKRSASTLFPESDPVPGRTDAAAANASALLGGVPAKPTSSAKRRIARRLVQLSSVLVLLGIVWFSVQRARSTGNRSASGTTATSQ